MRNYYVNSNVLYQNLGDTPTTRASPAYPSPSVLNSWIFVS